MPAEAVIQTCVRTRCKSLSVTRSPERSGSVEKTSAVFSYACEPRFWRLSAVWLMWRAKACATRRATKLASLLVVVTGNSLFLVELCLFSRRNSLFRCVGNLEEKARNQRVRRGCHVRSPLEIAKFPVIFPVSREFDLRLVSGRLRPLPTTRSRRGHIGHGLPPIDLHMLQCGT